jgi:amino acid transporter
VHVAEARQEGVHADTGEFETPLARTIGPGMLLVFVVGDVLGAGIYALVGVVAGETGGAIWTAFLLATALALLAAFSYAELVTKYPRADGAAVYVHSAFKVPFFTFVIAFAVMCSGIASAATLSRAFAGDYLSEFVDLPGGARRGGERRAHQHDHGLAADLWHVQAGRHPEGLRSRAQGAPDADSGNRLHDRAGHGAGRTR